MKKIINNKALYLFLLPLFFVLHGYVENFGLVTGRDSLILAAIYMGAVIVVYFLCWLLFKNHIKAALYAALIMGWYFFFGAIHDFLKNHSIPLLHKYSILLPLFVVVMVTIAIYLKRTKQTFYRVTFFLNMLLIIYLLVDLGSMGWKASHPNADRLSVYYNNNNHYKACDTCASPDIYLLLFDEYSSSGTLKEAYGYDNSGLDSFLVQQGFHYFPNSYSNYNFTSFSMASILNMQYISGLKDPRACTIEDYAYCNNLIRNSEVLKFLSSRQYDIVNYSVFDLAGNPTLVEQSVLPVKTRLITDQTLFNTMKRDIGWNLYMGKFEIKWLTRNIVYTNMNDNNMFMDLVKKESTRQSSRPRFVYVHLEMPHPPFFYDKDLRLRNVKDIYADGMTSVPHYLGYLPYTNARIKELVTTIQQNTERKAVIILLSDHAYRGLPAGQPAIHYFGNLDAVYFPGRPQQTITDSSSAVNSFRFIFNTLFNQQMPMLKDSVIFLKDKEMNADF